MKCVCQICCSIRLRAALRASMMGDEMSDEYERTTFLAMFIRIVRENEDA